MSLNCDNCSDCKKDWSHVNLNDIEIPDISQVHEGEQANQRIGKDNDAKALMLSLVNNSNQRAINLHENDH